MRRVLGRGDAGGKASPPCGLSHGFGPPPPPQVTFTARFTTPIHPAWTYPRMSPWPCPMG